MGFCDCKGVLIFFASLGIIATLAIVALSFGTDNWIKYTVNRKDLTKTQQQESTEIQAMARYHHTRNRGLFRECYPGNDTKFLDAAKDKVDDNCFTLDFSIPDSLFNPSTEYEARLHFLRAVVASFAIALFSFFLCCIFGFVVCCLKRSRWANVASILAFFGAFCVAVAMGCFHGAEYYERNEIKDADAKAFYQNWSSELKGATRRSYGWSYGCGWAGVALAAITGILYCFVGCLLSSERYEDSHEILEKSSRGRENHHYPMPMEPVYVVEDPYYGKPYYTGYPRGPAHIGPYLYDDGRRPVPVPTIEYVDQRNVW